MNFIFRKACEVANFAGPSFAADMIGGCSIRHNRFASLLRVSLFFFRALAACLMFSRLAVGIAVGALWVQGFSLPVLMPFLMPFLVPFAIAGSIELVVFSCVVCIVPVVFMCLVTLATSLAKGFREELIQARGLSITLAKVTLVYEILLHSPSLAKVINAYGTDESLAAEAQMCVTPPFGVGRCLSLFTPRKV